MTHLAPLMMSVIFLWCPAAMARAESPDVARRHAVITVNPLALLTGAIDAQVETRQSRSSALAFRGQIGSWSRADWAWGFFGVGAAWRMYPDHHALTGFYWGPGGAVSLVHARLKDDYGNRGDADGAVVGPTIELGGQFILDGGFTIDVGGGAAWYFGTVSASVSGNTMIAPVTGLKPFLRLALGYAWR